MSKNLEEKFRSFCNIKNLTKLKGWTALYLRWMRCAGCVAKILANRPGRP